MVRKEYYAPIKEQMMVAQWGLVVRVLEGKARQDEAVYVTTEDDQILCLSSRKEAEDTAQSLYAETTGDAYHYQCRLVLVYFPAKEASPDDYGLCQN